MTDTAWKTLGLSPGASFHAIRAAYRRRAAVLHPDGAGVAGDAAAFRELVAAYEWVMRQAVAPSAGPTAAADPVDTVPRPRGAEEGAAQDDDLPVLGGPAPVLGVPLSVRALGGPVRFWWADASGRRRKIRLDVPPHPVEGARVTLPGIAPPADDAELSVQLWFVPHPFLWLDGDDVHTEVPLVAPPTEGAFVWAATLSGPRCFRYPAAGAGLRRLRWVGHGAHRRRGTGRGDLVVHLGGADGADAGESDSKRYIEDMCRFYGLPSLT